MFDKTVKKLTARQEEVLGMIVDWINSHGYPPTRRDIGDHFNFRSPNASEEHLKALERKGAIIVNRHTSRGIIVHPKFNPPKNAENISQLPVVGLVAAGSPILAEEHVERYVDISKEMFSPRADYFLRVQGDSMTGVGIMDGDLLAVHKTTDVRNGQIVVARIDDEVTVKRFQLEEDGMVCLYPENPWFQRIVVDEDTASFEIEGISVGLVREH
ncbi:MAG: transcriptional repressor LexA [Gammaproteobacteria bacterium]|nr:transcriptional repressor LexA [Gammaproteobacteria bacterium]MDE0251924.1 transcriptional repressor LexA [Gammaproteobacteria bacterium]MDE0403068.1 transcriptional repressor LexA [Gammaproteobacteria bacterium]